jgi:FMN phosphatase YigB (HAD superfamily)
MERPRFHGRIIDGLTIDFWSTLAWDDPSGDSQHVRRDLRKSIVLDFLSEHGIDGSTEYSTNQKEYMEIWNDAWKNRHVTLDANHLVGYILERNRLPKETAGLEELANALDGTLREIPPQPIEGAIDAVHELAKHYKLAILSDTAISGPKSLDFVLESWGIRNLFSARVYSANVGVAKPHRGMFLTASQELGVPQHRLLHIGDLETTDILGAKSLGIAAIRFDGTKDSVACKACSMADKTVQHWSEIIELLVGESAVQDNPALKVNLG